MLLTAAVETMTITIRVGLAAAGGGCSGAVKIAGTMEERGGDEAWEEQD